MKVTERDKKILIAGAVIAVVILLVAPLVRKWSGMGEELQPKLDYVAMLKDRVQGQESLLSRRNALVRRMGSLTGEVKPESGKESESADKDVKGKEGKDDGKESTDAKDNKGDKEGDEKAAPKGAEAAEDGGEASEAATTDEDKSDGDKEGQGGGDDVGDKGASGEDDEAKEEMDEPGVSDISVEKTGQAEDKAAQSEKDDQEAGEKTEKSAEDAEESEKDEEAKQTEGAGEKVEPSGEAAKQSEEEPAQSGQKAGQSEEHVRLAAYVERVSQQAGMKFKRVTPKRIATGAKNAKTFDSAAVQFSVEGNIRNLVKMLHALEKGNRFVRIEQIQLQRNIEQGGTVEASLDVMAYEAKVR